MISVRDIAAAIQYGFTESATTIPVGPKFLRITDIQNGHVDWNNVPYCKCQEFEKYKLKQNDIVFARTGATTGKSFIISDCPDAVFASYLIRLRVKENVLARYVYYFFQSKNYWNQISQGLTGSTQGGFNASKLAELQLKIVDVEEQIKIVKQLDEIETALKKRKAANALTDQFLQSTFLSMFGNPVKNEKGWDMVQFGEMGDSRLGKMLDGKKQTGKNKFKYLGNSNVKWGRLDFTTLLQMDFDDNEKETFALRYGDVLICEGGEVGRTAIWKDEISNCYFQKAIHRVRLNKQKALPEYVLFLMWFYAKGGGFNDSVRSATIPHLTGVKLKAMPVPLPSLPLQQKFASIVADTDQLRVKQEQSETELGNLFQALLQKYFG